MDLSAASILNRCTSDPAFRSLGSLTRSTKGIRPSTLSGARNKRGPKIYPFLAKYNTLNYCIGKEEVSMADLTGFEKKMPFFEAEPKVVVGRCIGRKDRLCVGYIEERMALNRSLNIITTRSLEVDAMYLLGILGSRLLSFLYHNVHSQYKKGEPFPITLSELRKLPIPILRPIERGLIIGLVIQILNHKGTDPNSDTSHLERSVDQLVYRSFDLNEQEVKMVEGSTSSEMERSAPIPSAVYKRDRISAGKERVLG